MPVTENELTQFQAFAQEKLRSGQAESIEQLADLWRLEHPTPEQEAEDLASVQRGVADADAGRTVLSGDAFAEARKQVLSKP